MARMKLIVMGLVAGCLAALGMGCAGPTPTHDWASVANFAATAEETLIVAHDVGLLDCEDMLDLEPVIVSYRSALDAVHAALPAKANAWDVLLSAARSGAIQVALRAASDRSRGDEVIVAEEEVDADSLAELVSITLARQETARLQTDGQIGLCRLDPALFSNRRFGPGGDP